jgi:hypothetical protein
MLSNIFRGDWAQAAVPLMATIAVVGGALAYAFS